MQICFYLYVWSLFFLFKSVVIQFNSRNTAFTFRLSNFRAQNPAVELQLTPACANWALPPDVSWTDFLHCIFSTSPQSQEIRPSAQFEHKRSKSKHKCTRVLSDSFTNSMQISQRQFPSCPVSSFFFIVFCVNWLLPFLCVNFFLSRLPGVSPYHVLFFNLFAGWVLWLWRRWFSWSHWSLWDHDDTPPRSNTVFSGMSVCVGVLNCFNVATKHKQTTKPQFKSAYYCSCYFHLRLFW